MEYQTVNSREIVIPELAVTLHIHAVELPGSMSENPSGLILPRLVASSGQES